MTLVLLCFIVCYNICNVYVILLLSVSCGQLLEHDICLVVLFVCHFYCPYSPPGVKLWTGPTPGFQPLGELRDRPGKPRGK